jgi:hypothetical protein
MMVFYDDSLCGSIYLNPEVVAVGTSDLRLKFYMTENTITLSLRGRNQIVMCLEDLSIVVQYLSQ